MKVALKIDKKINKDNNYNKKISIIKEFIDFCIKELKLKKGLTVKLLSKNYSDDRITTGSYEIGKYITLARFEGRLLSDVLTTIAHELTHQMQDEQGKLNTNKPGKPLLIPDIGGEIEDEANATAGRLRKSFTLKYKQYKKSIYSLNESYNSFVKTLNEYDDTEEENNEELNDNFYNNFIHFDNIDLLIQLNDIKEVYDSGELTYYLITNTSEVLPFCEDIYFIDEIKEQLTTNKLLKLYLVYNEQKKSCALIAQNFKYLGMKIDNAIYEPAVLLTKSFKSDKDPSLYFFDIFKKIIEKYNASEKDNDELKLNYTQSDLKHYFDSSFLYNNEEYMNKLISLMSDDVFKNIIYSISGYNGPHNNKYKEPDTIYDLCKTLIKYPKNNINKINITINYLLYKMNNRNFNLPEQFFYYLKNKNIINIGEYMLPIMKSCGNLTSNIDELSSIISSFFYLISDYNTIIPILSDIIKVSGEQMRNEEKIIFFTSYLKAIVNFNPIKNNFNLYIDNLINLTKNDVQLRIFLNDFYFKNLKNNPNLIKTHEMLVLYKKLKPIFEDEDEYTEEKPDVENNVLQYLYNYKNKLSSEYIINKFNLIIKKEPDVIKYLTYFEDKLNPIYIVSKLNEAIEKEPDLIKYLQFFKNMLMSKFIINKFNEVIEKEPYVIIYLQHFEDKLSDVEIINLIKKVIKDNIDFQIYLDILADNYNINDYRVKQFIELFKKAIPSVNENYIRQFVKQNIKKLLL